MATCKSLLSAGILILTLSGAASAAPVQWTSGPGANGHWYEFINENLTFADAKSAAEAASHQGMPGYLVTVTSPEENQFVSETVASSSLAWAGATDNEQEGTWKWVGGPEAGQTLTYFNWSSGEPNNCCGGENHLQINWTPGFWNDHGGPGNSFQVNGYVVEYSAPVPEPETLALAMAGLVTAFTVRRKMRG